jgi:broad specificity phosphatase PhoE
MQAILLRHGQTDWNLAGRIQGRQDTELNQTGVEQIRRTCQRFDEQGCPFSLIVTSPLARAKQTAMICSEWLSLPVSLFPAFQERSFGQLEGLTFEEIKQSYGIHDVEEMEEAAYGAESHYDVQRRIREGFAILRKKHRGKRVLVVTHGSIIRIIAKLQGRDVGIIPNGDYLCLRKIR